MRSEVEPNAAARARQLAPALPQLRTIAVVVRFEMSDFAERATCQNLAHRQKIRIPTAILEDGDQSPAALRQGDQFRDRKSTRLNSSHEWISYAVFCLK